MTDENKTKKPFQVFQIYKVHTLLDMNNKYHHNNRTRVYDRDGNLITDNIEKYDIYNPEYSYLNDYMDKYSESNINDKWHEAVEGRNINRKVQTNASRCFEFVVSASDTFAPGWKQYESDRNKWKKYFNEARSFFAIKYGSDLIIDWAEHWDETTPHMHALVVPIIELTEKEKAEAKNKEFEYKYSSSEFMHGRNGMKMLHTEFYEEVGKYHGLERGEENSRAKHGELKKYKKELADEIEKTKRLNSALENKTLELDTAIRGAKRSKQFYEERESQICSRHEAQIEVLEKEALRRFEEAKAEKWKVEDDVIDDVADPEEDESASHYALRIKPAIRGFIDHCKEVVRKNNFLGKILTKSFNTEINGKKYHFGRGLVSEFKTLMSNLCKMTGQTPEKFGGISYNPVLHGNFNDDLKSLEEKYQKERLEEMEY